MSEGVGLYFAGRFFLDHVVTDGIGGAHGFFNVAAFEILLAVVSPDAGVKICLQLESNRHLLAVRFAATGRDFVRGAGQLLHVVTNFVSDDVGLGKIAWRVECLCQLVVKAQVDVDLFIRRAIERSRFGAARAATTGLNHAPIENQGGWLVFRVVASELRSPNILGAGEHDADKFGQLCFLGGEFGRSGSSASSAATTATARDQGHRIDSGAV